MSAPAIAAGLAGVLVGGFAWSLISSPKNDSVDPTAGSIQRGKSASASDLQSENSRLKGDLARLRAEFERKQVAGSDGDVTPKQETGETKDAATTPSELAFTDPRFQDALASIDWDSVGGSMKDMIPLIAGLAEAIAEGKDPNLAEVGEMQKLNANLLKAAQKIMEAKIPGTGVNGAFTHPAVVANQFASALKAAGLALSKDQKDSLDRAMKFYSSKDESLRLAAGDKELALDVLTEEMEFKDAFYKEARGMLSDEQRNALFSEKSAGRIGLDVFDSALMLAGRARPVQAKDAAELSSTLSTRIGNGLKLDAANEKKLGAIIHRWSHALPSEFWADKGNTLDKQGMLTSSRVRAAARRQSALMREILRSVDLSPEARANLKKNLRVFVPLPR